MKRKVLIPIDQQTEETPQTPPSVETTDSNLKSEDLFVTNDFIPTEEEKEEMPMSEEKFPTIDTNLFGSTSPDSSEKDDWTFNTKEATKKQTQVADDFREAFGSVKMSLTSRRGSSNRITRSQLLKKDSQLHMRRNTSKSLKVLATCPYCKGGGCNECDQSGTL